MQNNRTRTQRTVLCIAGFILLWQAITGSAAAANAIQVENALPGTNTWALSNPATNREIEGYASLTSVSRGAQIKLFVNTAESSFSIDVFRTGWYNGAGGREVLGPIVLSGTRQLTAVADPVTGLIECNWTNPYTVTIPDSWLAGVYLVKLTALNSGKQSYIVFVVRDDRPALYLMQCCVTTYQAYNNWPGQNVGGKSLYDYNSSASTAAVKVSFNRPYIGSGCGDYLTWEYNMVRFLEREGYDVTYCTNIDVHENPTLLMSHKGFLSVGHDEYWSWEMRANVTSARDSGEGLGFFSANVCYWQIRLEPSLVTGAPDRTQVGYKASAFTRDPLALDNDKSNDRLITTLWRSNPALPSEEELVGVEYIEDPVNSDIVIADPTHWALRGTNAAAGDRLVGLLGYEVDGLLLRSARPNVSIIAHSPIPNLNSNSAIYAFSDMVSYDLSNGATVFAAGSIQWAWGLDDYGVPAIHTSRLSAAAQQITRNVLNRFANSPGPPAQNSIVVNDSVTGTGLNQWDYGPGWSACPVTVGYQLDEHYATTTGAIAHFRFNGNQVKVYTVQEPAGGNIGYSLDGGPEQLVSNYSATLSAALSYASPVVSLGNHDLAIRETGTHQAGSLSNTITVDKAEVAIVASQSGPTTTVNDSVTGTGLNQWDYGAGWSACPVTGAYQNDEHYATSTGAVVHFRFNGSQVKIYTVQEPAGGNIGYSLDGGPEQLVSNYSATLFPALSYTSPVLALASHDLAIRETGTHQAGSLSNTITVDKAEVFAAAPVALATVNDSVTGTGLNQWDFSAGWSACPVAVGYQGDEHYSFVTGATVHFRFSGSQVKIYTVQEPAGGNIGYSLDGAAEQIISNYSPSLSQTLSYTSPVVTPGNHDLVIRVVGSHQSGSISNTITVDKAEVY